MKSITEWLESKLQGLPVERHDPADGLPLQVVSYGVAEVKAALDVLLSTWVTLGKEVAEFESEWAQWCGAREAVMVNSGSSANLVALAALVHTGALEPGDEVIVPAVAWSTSLFPVSQMGLVPVIVDVDAQNWCVSMEAVEAARGPRTRGIVAVHLLGQPAPSRALTESGLVVLEDACAAPGAKESGARVGTLGGAGTFSFFFSHHISTIEGGIITTQDPAIADAARSLRAHGWIREMKTRETVSARHPDIDPRFLFDSVGWNLRPTEIAGAMGRQQLKRLDAWLEQRRVNHRTWCGLLEDLNDQVEVFPEIDGTEHAAFAFPLLLRESAQVSRETLMAHLQSQGIETRPVSGSNLSRQPAFSRIAGARVATDLPVADAIHERGLFVGNSHAFHEGHGELLSRALREVLRG